MLNLPLILITMLGTSTTDNLTLSGSSCCFAYLTGSFLSHMFFLNTLSLMEKAV